ncbi:sterol desaturase family protein [bacterium]|nr:sterol desaturase family protein [bacterium]
MNKELTLRLGFFLGTLLLIAIWEILWPRRPLAVSKAVRWYSNFGIVVLNTLFVRWVFPVLAMGMAVLAQDRKWGLFNNIEIPEEAALLISIIILDLAIYFQHLMFHAVPRLWRLHRMHHTDLDYDVTTALRFHPLEIILSMLIKLSVISVLGPPVLAVLVFEILLNAMAMFNHGNIRIPAGIDRVLRLFVVTPDMHRVHHSIIRKETDSNFGFSLSWWDYLFGTYRAQPQHGHEGMTIGIELFRKPIYSHLHWLLLQPFLDKE